MDIPANSSARMQAFECPICAPKRYFVTEIGLRTHVADRHPWRSLPPSKNKLAPSRAALPEPGWLRERQAAAAASVYPQPQAPFHQPHPPMQSQPMRYQPANGGQPMQRGNANNAFVTFDTQSQLSDDVFVEEAGLNGGGGGGGRARSYRQPQQQEPHRFSLQQRQQQPYAPESGYDEYPPPDYDQSPMELARSIDAVDSSARKRRDLVTTRRPWYDSEDYAGPRNLMEKRPGGYFDDQTELNDVDVGAYSNRRMRHEIEERDSRIETLRMEIDRLWDERMRLLKQEAQGIRAVKDQGTAALYWEGGGHDLGLRNQRSFINDRQPGGVGAAAAAGGHAFQPVVPHSRLQLYRQLPLQQQQQQYLDRRAAEY